MGNMVALPVWRRRAGGGCSRSHRLEPRSADVLFEVSAADPKHAFDSEAEPRDCAAVHLGFDQIATHGQLGRGLGQAHEPLALRTAQRFCVHGGSPGKVAHSIVTAVRGWRSLDSSYGSKLP